MIKKRIIIIGAGPAGLSTGYHLKKSGFNDFLILEKNSYPGGLSTSFKDKKGFTWDIGGHVIHSKNKEFVKFCKKILKNKIGKQKRKSFIYFKNKFIPYPFQNNIAFLPKEYKQECFRGLVKDHSSMINFHSWILNNFGKGIAKHFMIPQNEKTWQYPLNKMGTMWLAKKVNLPPLEKIKKECLKNNPKIISWGSNQEFYYPENGGIGQLWQKTAQELKPNIKFNSEVIKINLKKKILLFKNLKNKNYDKITDIGNFVNYKSLVSTIPINELIKISNAPLKIKQSSQQLKYTSGLVIGLGFDKKPVFNDWHWIYFPDKIYPFFRACLLSNFGKNTVPKPSYSSFLVEIVWRSKKLDKNALINQISKQIGKIFFNDQEIKPISIFSLSVPYYYPIPTLNRDKILKELHHYLNNNNIYSLGRFGSWKYEKGNMDDCFEEGQKVTENLF